MILPEKLQASELKEVVIDSHVKVSESYVIESVSSLSSCRSTILLDSRSLLRGQVVSDQAIAEALVSTMLLEDSSPRQALADFLLARKASIQQLLNQPQHGILARRLLL